MSVRQYILMNKHTPILEIKINQETGDIVKIDDVYNLDYLPIGISIRKGLPEREVLNHWWKGRCIPASRDGLDSALEIMGIDNQSQLIMKCFGLSLSDQYWMNPKENNLKWENVNFFTNDFSSDVGMVLYGQQEVNTNIDFMSPDNTSDGWLRKKWKIVDGERYLLKAGSRPFQQEPYNEVIASKILERFNVFPHVPYEMFWNDEEPGCLCKNFINQDTELVTAYSLYCFDKKENHVSLYDYMVQCFEKVGIHNAREFFDYLLVIDYLIVNTDRHLNNFGVIRDVNSLEITGIAPIFDSGTSLWHNLLEFEISQTKNLSKPFRKFHEEQIRLVSSFDKIDLSKLHGIEEEWSELLKTSKYIDEKRRSALCKGLKKRISELDKIINNH